MWHQTACAGYVEDLRNPRRRTLSNRFFRKTPLALALLFGASSCILSSSWPVLYCGISVLEVWSLTSDRVASRLLCPADSDPSPDDSGRGSSWAVWTRHWAVDRLKDSVNRAISSDLSQPLKESKSSVSLSKSISATVSDPESGSVTNSPELESLCRRCFGVSTRVRVLKCSVLDEAVASVPLTAPITILSIAEQDMLRASSDKKRSRW